MSQTHFLPVEFLSFLLLSPSTIKKSNHCMAQPICLIFKYRADNLFILVGIYALKCWNRFFLMFLKCIGDPLVHYNFLIFGCLFSIYAFFNLSAFCKKLPQNCQKTFKNFKTASKSKLPIFVRIKCFLFTSWFFGDRVINSWRTEFRLCRWKQRIMPDRKMI